MDLSLYRDGRLVVCYEVKEKASQIERLLKDIKQYEQRIISTSPIEAMMRLEKPSTSKAPTGIFRTGGHRCSAGISGGHPPGKAFELHRDVIPWA